MALSVLDLFRIGIGPSSSHTVGPMRAARLFAGVLDEARQLARVARIRVELYGSLAATGRGHGTPRAIMLGLEGEEPETVDAGAIAERVAAICSAGRLTLAGRRELPFDESGDLLMRPEESLPEHTNGMRFTAHDAGGAVLTSRTYYSIGGGFVVDAAATGPGAIVPDTRVLPYPFKTASELLAQCRAADTSISGLMLANEAAYRPEADTRRHLQHLWEVMCECVRKGCAHEGVLPGGLKVRRRAPDLYRQLSAQDEATAGGDPLSALDWVSLYALAVNEENAGGGRIVTAPTNGAAGIIPAVLLYYDRFVPGANAEGIERFLLTAAAIGFLYKENASISGAEVGCQGEVGSACSMAAGALTEVLGGSPAQVENAAEIAMEHNLGLTCDPIGGLVQVPCIERNAMAAVKAIHASRMALRGDGTHFVSLDKVIKTMRDTGRDMQAKYKETARGGLALNVLEVPVNVVDC